MTIRDSLTEAMHLPQDSDTMSWLGTHGIGVANEQTMSQAIHDVYCGITSDHDHPNEKDHEQARKLLDAMHRAAALAD
ncbi:MAG TPA: hypothetical protein VFI34_06670 [Candidatus Limnocylindrales bacterium]|nr:hypothetical protein [Candidatus Limnocylindrales bacterium]